MSRSSARPIAVVTGASGFIGRHLVDALLSRGVSVVGFDLRPAVVEGDHYRHVIGDVRRVADVRCVLRDAEPTEVYHLAARTDLDGKSLADYSSNTEGVRVVAEAIADTSSIRAAVCFSSQLVCRVGYVPASDEDVCPDTVYGRSKVETERNWRGVFGCRCDRLVVRPTTIWGPGMNPHYLRFFDMLKRGTYFHVGHRPLMKSYGFVGNTVFQVIALLSRSETLSRQVWFLADYEPIALRRWAEAFARELGGPKPRQLPEVVAVLLARIGDLALSSGIKVPFNSFRLRNVLTEYVFDQRELSAVVGPLPYSEAEGVSLTSRWVLSCLSASASASAAVAGPVTLPKRRSNLGDKE